VAYFIGSFYTPFFFSSAKPASTYSPFRGVQDSRHWRKLHKFITEKSLRQNWIERNKKKLLLVSMHVEKMKIDEGKYLCEYFSD